MPTRSLQHAVQRSVRRHILLTLLVALGLSVVMVAGVWVVADSEGHRSARHVSSQVGSALIVSLESSDYRRIDPALRADLMDDVTPFIRSDLVHRVKVWSVEGDRARIAFSDEPRLEGEVRPVDPALAARLAAGEVVSLRLPDDDEHRFELAASEPLIEVYIAFHDSAGNPLWLEIYVPVDTVATTWHTVGVLLPIMLVALLALGIATIPITVSFARRIEQGQEEHRAALRYGLAASDIERRELAQQLHDGVIQDLAGAGMVLEAIRRAEDGPTAPLQRGLLEEAHRVVEDDIRQLRDLASGLLPSTVDAEGLGAAITAMAQQLQSRDTAVAVDVETRHGLRADTATLLHRVARELLRNAFQHSRATRIDVRLTPAGDDLVLTVADNGRGFDRSGARPEGHIGLMLVERAVAEAGGRFALTTAPGEGTAVSVTLSADPEF
ncbi:sensor histidine kinase [Pseudonocardia sp. TRM90224]|uniref:sensor histidine kinase n=1 Tax=Pseudonocardia sp. TRM90224 TaxID=2812678 RepID=UPI001E3D7F7B|nr:ATP-binding protein [Pseudonocardia sp. TRM90224]